jgi:uncharacterized repeat protein (TIGR02059 family)
LDAARNESGALTAVKAKTLPVLPVWPENAVLTTESIMATELTLRWPQVSNPSDLDGYKVYVDDVEEASLPAIQNYYELGGLNSGNKYILAVKPFNATGQTGAALETMAVTPGAGGLTFTFSPYAIDKGESGFYHNFEIVNLMDLDNFSLAWNFSNGLDKNLRFNLECVHLIEKSSGQEVPLDLGTEPYVSSLEGVFEAGDFKYISTGGGDGTGDGTGGGDSGATKTRLLKFEPGAATLAQITKGAQYVIEIDPEFTANNGTAKLGKIFSFAFTTAVDDNEVPSWPADAEISASKVGTDAFVLNWPKAEDNVGVIEYQLYQQGESLELIKTFNSDTTSYKMENLTPDTTYNLILRARDAKSQYTPDLTLSVVTLLSDDQAPTWAAGSKLTADDVLTDSMDLSWTAAADNVEVTGYRLLKNGSVVTELDANTFSYHITQLTPATNYIFKVEARDKAGNYSTTGPKLVISTLEGEADTTPPYWTSNGSWSTSVTYAYDKTYPVYHWPWAADNVAVSAYLVYRNGVQIAQVDAYTNSFSDVLDVDNSDYTYSVYAVDAAGNQSLEGRPMTVKSGDPNFDVYSPVWPADTNITLSEFTDTTMKIKWTPAQDNVAVRGYVVVKDGLWVEWTDRGDSETDHRSYKDCFVVYNPIYNPGPASNYPPLVSGETYTFSIKAFDTVENSSKGDPKITLVMGTNPTAGAGIPFSLVNVENKRGSLNSITGALNQVLAPQDPEKIKFSWEFDEPLAANYADKVSLVNAGTGDRITLDPANFQYNEAEGKGILTLDLAQTSIKLADNTVYVVKLDKTLAAQSGEKLDLDIAWQFTTDVADKDAPYWGAEDALAVYFLKAPTIATLTWPAAGDNVAVTQYKVYQGDVLLETLPAEALTYDVEALAVNTSYSFKVVAGDYLENFSVPLTAAFNTPDADNTAPAWQPDDALTFTDIASDNVRVSWPAASDDPYQVKAYKLYQDDIIEPFAEVAGDVREYTVTGLAGETTYDITVKAFDFSGNFSGLTGEVTTIADQVSPLWPEGSMLQAKNIKDNSVTLYWEAATDNVGVTKYNIYCNGDKIQSVDGATCEAIVSGLKGSTEYTFAVEAEDLKENKSADKLSLVQWTAPGSITAGAAFPFNLDQPLSHNVGHDADSNTLNNAVDGSFTKNNVTFTFSFDRQLAENSWLNNIELKTGDGTVIPLESVAFTYLEKAGGSSLLKIAVAPDLVTDGEYMLTVKESLQAADGTPLGRNFTWTFNVSVGPYGVTDIAAGYNSYSPFLPASSRYYLMLKDDGSVWTWGNNDYGTLGDGTTDSRDVPTRVEALNDIVALEAGRDSCFALDEDGAVWAWGSNEFGQLGRGTVPGGTSGRHGNNTPEKIEGLPAIEKLHYGFGSVAALNENGEVWIWGNTAGGTPLKVNGLSNVNDVAAEFHVFMAVGSDGDVYSFGSGSTPVRVAGLSEIVAVDAEGIDQKNTVRMALKADGTAYIWDANTGEPVTSSPTRVENATQIKAVIADGPYVLGTNGQVSNITYTAAPVLGDPINGLGNVVKLDSSANGGLALQTDGTLLQFIGTEVNEVPLNLDPVDVPVWPEDSAIEITNQAETGLTLNWQKPDPDISTFAVYQEGNLIATVSGNTLSYNVLGLTKGQTYSFKLKARFVNSDWSITGPEITVTMSDWNPVMQGAGRLAMSPGHTLMIGDDGSVWAWGQNEYGQLGTGNNSEQLTPVKINGLTDIARVAAGDNHSLALDQAGNVWAWGKNDLYQLGNDTTSNSNIPVKIISGNIKDISSAANYNLALKEDGTVLSWGEPSYANCYYALEGGSAKTPVQKRYNNANPNDVHPFTEVKDIAAGRTFSTYLFSDGRICRQGYFIDAVGASTYSPMGRYSTPLGIAAIEAGDNFVIALKEDGTVLALGDNNSGQYGNGTQGNGTPADPRPYGVATGLNNIVAVAAGGYHALALSENGDVYTWGKNLNGQLGTGKTDIHLTPVKVGSLADITAIGGGPESSIAFRNMQKVSAWGNNDGGQLGNGSIISAKTPAVVKMTGYDEDIDAPVWPAYFALMATDINQSGTTLVWTPAKDDIGIAAYEIYVNGDKKAEVNGIIQEYVLNDLTANMSYTFGIKARDAVGNTSVMSKTISATMEDSDPQVSPILAADITNNILGQPIDITFTDDAIWRNAITGITIDGTLTETSGYEISAGKIAFDAGVFDEAKDYVIIVKATGYADASITQTINSAPAPVPAPKLLSGEITSKGDLSLTFDKEMADPAGTQGQFTVTVDGAAVAVSGVETTNTVEKIKLVLSTKATGANNVTVSYTKSADPAKQLKSVDGGLVESFSTQIGEALTNPPTLKKDASDNHVGNPVDITFIDDAAWRNAISDVTIDGSSISGQYSVSAGKITIGAGLFTEARDYEIAVKATGYSDAGVIQKMHKVITGSNVTVDESNKNLAVTGSTPATTVTIPEGIDNATINVGELLNAPAGGEVQTGALPALTITADTSINAAPVQVEIPAGTTVSAPEGWDGTINVPSVRANNSVAVTPDEGKTATVKAVIEVGFGDVPLTFSQAVKLVIPGQAGKDVGYFRNGTFTPITNVCATNSQAWADANLPAGGDGKVDDGQDLVIWTKHFTLFAAYEQSATGNDGGGGGGGSGSGTSGGLTVSFNKAKLSPTDTLLQFDFGNGIDSTLDSNLSKIKVYEKNTGSEVQYSDYNYIKQGQGDDAVKIRRLELMFDNLKSGTIYVVELAAGFEANNGSTLGAKKSFEFTTTGTAAAAGGAGAAAEQEIGRDGGTINEYGAIIVIPAASFNQSIKVAVQKITDVSDLPMAAKSILASDVIEITKDQDGSFDKAVTITLTFDKSKVDTSKYDLIICYLNEEENRWIALDNIKVDLAAATVSGEIKHFTKFAIIAVEKAQASLPLSPGELVNLSDIQEHWAQPAIAELISLGAIGGYPDGTFKPDQGISRAEFASILVKALQLEQKQGKVFNDTAGHWAQDAIATAAAYGIVNGYSDTSFGPDDSITREQMAVMVVKAAKLAEVKEGKAFADGNKISAWAGNAVATASQNQIINGYPDNTFRPQNNASRAEAATVIVKALQLAA